MTKTTKTAAKPAPAKVAAKAPKAVVAAAASKKAALDAAAKAPAPKPAKPAPAKATEKVTSRSAGYSAGELAATKAPSTDKIANVTSARSGPEGTLVLESEAFATNPKGNALAITKSALTADLRKLAVLGGSLKAVRAYMAANKPDAKLAHGVTARLAPNSAKAASDQHRADPVAKAPAKPASAKAPAKAAPAAKPAKAPNVTKEAGKRLSGQAYGGKIEPAMSIAIVADANPYKVGSKAHATFELFRKAKTVAKFKELVAAKPDAYDAGYIRYAARDGFITVA